MTHHFFRENMQMDNKHMKRCLTLLAIREMQMKVTMIEHFTPLGELYFFKKENNKCWQVCGEIRTLVHCWWECKIIQPLYKSDVSSKVKHRITI